MPRIKPTLAPVYPIHSLEDVDNALGKIAALKRQIDLVTMGAAEEMDAIKARASAESEPFRQQIAGLELSIGRFAEAEKESLFAKKKSLRLTFGVIGFRASSKLKTKAKWTFERVLATLKDRGMKDFIRVKEEIDKEKLKCLAPDALSEVGCTVKTEDAFYYELPEEQETDAIPAP